MTIKIQIIKRIQQALKYLSTENISFKVEIPKKKEHGDFSTNVAMQLASVLKQPPHKIAKEFIKHFDCKDLIKEIFIAGSGFINFRLENESSSKVLYKIKKEGDNYGKSKTGEGIRVLVEFVSANPTGPLHIGHIRGAVVGDVLCRLLSASGYSVEREYYFNDAGNQMQMLGNTLQLKIDEMLGKKVDWPKQYYRGSYMDDIAKTILDKFGEEKLKIKHELAFYTELAVSEILKTIKTDLKKMEINFDNWFSETTLHKNNEITNTLKTLKKNNCLYEQDGATYLRTINHGDEKDRVIIKSDGSYTYILPDIAYHNNKYKRGFNHLINVLGGDHHGYVPRLKAGISSLGHQKDDIQCVLVQMVSVLKENVTTKISTRSGEFITLEEMINEIGTEVVRYFFAMHSSDTQMVFDWNLAKDTSMNNPIYYVQYAHARCCSLFRKAEETGIIFLDISEINLSLLSHPDEQKILHVIENFPEIINSATIDLAPHYITNYLYNLAQHFHTFFAQGNNDPSLRILLADKPSLTQARFALIDGLRIVLANGLRLLGIKPIQKM